MNIKRMEEVLRGTGITVKENAEMYNPIVGYYTGWIFSKEGLNVSPTVNPDNFNNEEELLEAVIDAFKSVPSFDIKESVKKENLRLCVSGTPIKNGFCRPYLDMYMYVRVLLPEMSSSEGTASAILNKRTADLVNLSEEDAFATAIQNTTENFYIQNINSMLNEIICVDSDEYIDVAMYVATNAEKMNGAGIIACPEAIQKFAERLGEAVFILPSSIHEILLVPSSIANAEGLREMVTYVNPTLAPGMKLTDSVYFYDPETREVTIA